MASTFLTRLKFARIIKCSSVNYVPFLKFLFIDCQSKKWGIFSNAKNKHRRNRTRDGNVFLKMIAQSSGKLLWTYNKCIASAPESPLPWVCSFSVPCRAVWDITFIILKSQMTLLSWPPLQRFPSSRGHLQNIGVVREGSVGMVIALSAAGSIISTAKFNISLCFI